MRRNSTLTVAWMLAWVCVTGPLFAAERFLFPHENVLGTSLEIQLLAESDEAARQAEARVLAEIERLARIFSSYDPASEFSTWQKTIGVSTKISPELFHVLEASDHYQMISRGAFHPASQQLSDMWKEAEKRQVLPAPGELRSVVQQIQKRQWVLDAKARSATRLASSALTFNAIAKGTIIDAAVQAGLSSQVSHDVHGICVCIGGDLRVGGEMLHPVQILDPKNGADNALPVTRILVRDRGVATSGKTRRGFQIGGRWYSHIFDPRSGEPCQHIASATVIAPTAEQADAIATILNVLAPSESEQLAASLKDVEFLLIDSQGKKRESPGWKKYLRSAEEPLALADEKGGKEGNATSPQAADQVELLELVVKIELNNSDKTQYRRPYVAIWLENEEEFPVRTGLLFLQTRLGGARWHRDLLRWYRKEEARRLVHEKSLVDTVSIATRGPGEYKAVFDGRNDQGKPLPRGKYTLFIEAAREHGTYQLIKKPLELGAEPFPETKLKGNIEIKSASVEYRKAAPAQPQGK